MENRNYRPYGILEGGYFKVKVPYGSTPILKPTVWTNKIHGGRHQIVDLVVILYKLGIPMHCEQRI